MTRAELGSEEQLGAIVVAWLESLGADVFQEVENIDIVARVGAELWAIECKRALSMKLLTQGMDRRRLVHRVFIAAPYTRHMREVGAICEELGIGLLDVHIGSDAVDSGNGFGASSVREIVPSRRWNTRPVDLAARLRPQHKTHARAGSARGGSFTPFLDTCEQLARVVRERPGITLRDAVSAIRHHYATSKSARGTLAKWITVGKVPGVRWTNGKLHTLEAA